MYPSHANRKPHRSSSNLAVGLFAVAIAMSAATVPNPALAQQPPASAGCPSPGHIPLDWTGKQFLEACPPTTTLKGDPGKVDDVTTLNCENLKRAMELKPRASVGTGAADVHVSQQQYQESCAANRPPVTQVAAPKFRDGIYDSIRGYTNPPPNSQGICDQYKPRVLISGKRIEFDSSGFRWAGTISNDGYVDIRTAGITPLPGNKPLKHETSIQGPAGKASLYNGFCGEGYFRLSP